MMTGFGVQNQDRPQLLPKPLAKLEQGFLPLAQTSFMANLSDQQREALHRSSVIRRYQRGESLFQFGEKINGFLVIEQGKVKMTRFGEQQERILWIAGEGDALGYAAFQAEAQYDCEAICISDFVSIRSLNKMSFLNLAQCQPSLLINLLGGLQGTMQIISSQLEFATASVPLRICQTLISLTKRFGQAINEDWIYLDIALSHEELASLAGTTRVSFTQTSQVLRERDLLRGTRGSYWLRLAALEQWLETLIWNS